jgi:pyruvate/2-oxoglutarate dehydrogenase complex dihydrolipoamide dehydrogenase (E3) component
MDRRLTNITCMPSKNEIRSAEVAHLSRHAAEFIAASQFNQHKQETPDVRVLFTPY